MNPGEFQTKLLKLTKDKTEQQCCQSLDDSWASIKIIGNPWTCNQTCRTSDRKLLIKMVKNKQYTPYIPRKRYYAAIHMVPRHAGSQLLAGPCLKTSRVVSLTIEQAKGIFKTGTNLRTGQQPACMTDRWITQLLALNQRITCHKGAVPRMMLWLKSLDEDSRDEGGFVKNKKVFIEESSSAKRY